MENSDDGDLGFCLLEGNDVDAAPNPPHRRSSSSSISGGYCSDFEDAVLVGARAKVREVKP